MEYKNPYITKEKIENNIRLLTRTIDKAKLRHFMWLTRVDYKQEYAKYLGCENTDEALVDALMALADEKIENDTTQVHVPRRVAA